MVKLALLARMEAKPGKEEVVADFLRSALPRNPLPPHGLPYVLASPPLGYSMRLLTRQEGKLISRVK
jgi:hypothetical protein